MSHTFDRPGPQMAGTWLIFSLPLAAVLLWTVAIEPLHERTASLPLPPLPRALGDDAGPGSGASHAPLARLASGAIAGATLARDAAHAAPLSPGAAIHRRATQRSKDSAPAPVAPSTPDLGRAPGAPAGPGPRNAGAVLGAVVCRIAAAGRPLEAQALPDTGEEPTTGLRISRAVDDRTDLVPVASDAAADSLHSAATAVSPGAGRAAQALAGGYPGAGTLTGTKAGGGADDVSRASRDGSRGFPQAPPMELAGAAGVAQSVVAAPPATLASDAELLDSTPHAPAQAAATHARPPDAQDSGLEGELLLAQAGPAGEQPEAPLVPAQFLGEEGTAPPPASQPPEAGGFTPAPETAPSGGAGAGPAGTGGAAAGGERLPSDLAGFKSLTDFLAFCREKKKVNFVMDPKIPSEKINTFIRFDVDDTVDLDRLIDLVLQKNELTSVRLNATNILVTPAHRKLWMVPLKHAKPEDVEAAVASLDPEFSGKVKAVPNSNAVRVTAFTWQVDAILRAVQEMDRYAADQHTRTYSLDYATPEVVLGQLSKFFGTTITVDTDKQGTITIAGPAQKLHDAEKLIRALDRPRPHALIQLHLVEAAGDRASNIGIETPNQLGMHFDAQNSSINLLPQILKPQAATFNAGVAMNLQSERGNVRVLADPQVRLVEKEKATINIGRKLPVKLTTAAKSSAGDNVQLSQNIQFIDDGLKLEMELEKVNVRKELTLKVSVDVITVDVPGIDGVPVQSNRATTSVIRVANHDTVVIGGFVNETEDHRVREIPVLGRLPIVGRLFARENQSNDRRDILLLMTPYVLSEKGGS